MKFLIVDDNDTVRLGLARQLASAGHEAETAVFPIDVLSRLHQVPDVVVMDYHLPTSNGCELLLELRRHDGWKDVPVVVITSDVQAELPAEAGLCAELVKPFEVEDLLRVVSLLRERRAM